MSGKKGELKKKKDIFLSFTIQPGPETHTRGSCSWLGALDVGPLGSSV